MMIKAVHALIDDDHLLLMDKRLGSVIGVIVDHGKVPSYPRRDD